MKIKTMIGFSESRETGPGIFEDIISEERYTMEVIKNRTKFSDDSSMNTSLVLSNSFSLIASQSLLTKYHTIKYVVFNNTKWSVQDVVINRPRIILVAGEVFNHGN